MLAIHLKAIRVFSILALAVAPAFGNLLYVSSGDGTVGKEGSVVVYDSLTGAYLQTLINSSLYNPRGITMDTSGNLYVAETTASQAAGSGSIKQYKATTGAFIQTVISGLNTPEQLDWRNGHLFYTQFTAGNLNQLVFE